MGEIRSTMDIIMEKARGLTVSDEEKKQFKEREMTGTVRGLLQRCLDGVLAMDRFRVEMAAVQERDKDMADRLLREETLKSIEPGRRNEIALSVLKEVLGMDTGGITERLEAFSRQIEEERSSREAILIERFKESDISGSAVIPNIEADPEWHDFLKEKLKNLRNELTSF